MTPLMAAILVTLLLLPAESLSQQMPKSFPRPVFERAVGCYDRQQLDSAYTLLRKQLQMEPQFAPAYYYLGLILQDVNLLDSAETEYKMAIQIDSSYASPYSDLGVIRLHQGRLPEARAFVEKSIQLDSTFAIGYLNLAAILWRLNDKEGATDALFHASVHNPDRVLETATSALVHNNDPESAEYYLRTILAAHPDHSHALFTLGQTERMVNKLDLAEAHLERAFQTSDLQEETFALIYVSYFRLLFDKGKYDKILSQTFQRVGGQYPDAHFYRSLAYFKQGEHSKFLAEADTYFQLSKEERPASLDDWATKKCEIQK